MNVNMIIGYAIAGAGVWYALTGRTMPLRVFVGATAGSALLGALRQNGVAV